MINLTAGVGETVNIPTTTPADTVNLIVETQEAPERVEIVSYNSVVHFLSFRPTKTGNYFVICDDALLACVVVMKESLPATLSSIQGGVLGSWHWDKVKSTLVLYDIQGTELGTYDLLDSANQASRELK